MKSRGPKTKASAPDHARENESQAGVPSDATEMAAGGVVADGDAPALVDTLRGCTHSHGPWHRSGGRIYLERKTPGGQDYMPEVAIVPIQPHSLDDARTCEELEANARLIQAAPEMMDTLKSTLAMLENMTSEEYRLAADKPIRDRIASVIERVEGGSTVGLVERSSAAMEDTALGRLSSVIREIQNMRDAFHEREIEVVLGVKRDFVLNLGFSPEEAPLTADHLQRAMDEEAEEQAVTQNWAGSIEALNVIEIRDLNTGEVLGTCTDVGCFGDDGPGSPEQVKTMEMIQTPYGPKTPELLCKAMDAFEREAELLKALKGMEALCARGTHLGGTVEAYRAYTNALEVCRAAIAKAEGPLNDGPGAGAAKRSFGADLLAHGFKDEGQLDCETWENCYRREFGSFVQQVVIGCANDVYLYGVTWEVDEAEVDAPEVRVEAESVADVVMKLEAIATAPKKTSR